MSLIGVSKFEAFFREVGGIAMAPVKSFKIMNSGKKNPKTQDWEKAQRIFETLL